MKTSDWIPSFLPLVLVFFSSLCFGASSVPVDIKEGTKSFQGSLFLPQPAQKSVPLVVVVHEWWGKTSHIENRAKKVTDELGYAALAVDLYGEGQTAENPKDAQMLATPFYKDPELAVKRLNAYISAALEAAKQKQVSIDPLNIAVMGYCFGGSQALNLARANEMPAGTKLQGVISFHGGLASSLKAKGPLSPKVLVLHGAADKMVKDEEVQAFKKEMKDASADLTYKAYAGALHAFTNPKATETGKKYQIPVAYDKAADQDSWEMLRVFLKKIFQKK